MKYVKFDWFIRSSLSLKIFVSFYTKVTYFFLESLSGDGTLVAELQDIFYVGVGMEEKSDKL